MLDAELRPDYCSLPHWFNENLGTMGVVGPMRIEYSRIMAMVNYMARLIERRLSEETPFTERA